MVKTTQISRGESIRLPAGGEKGSRVNVGRIERIGSAAVGGALAFAGLRNGGVGGLLLALGGGALLYRGVSGHCPAYQRLGIDTSAGGPRMRRAFRIREVMTVARPRDEVYAFWRDLENLPRFMKHLDSVDVRDSGRSHWTAPIPGGLGTIEWDAEVIAEEPGERISWRSVEGSDVWNAGTVLFRDAPAGRGTEVEAEIEYVPPAGGAGAAAAKLLTPVFSNLVRNDIRRFKQLMEAGELATSYAGPERS